MTWTTKKHYFNKQTIRNEVKTVFPGVPLINLTSFIRGYYLKYCPFRGFKYLSGPSFSDKNLNNKISSEYYTTERNILLYCIIYIMKQLKTLKRLNNKCIFNINLFLNTRYDDKLYIILAA